MILHLQFYQVIIDLVSHYFRQNFSQVTNPPIDSLRENKVMSLKTRFGNLGNILDFDNLTEENIYVLESPILTNSQFKKFKNLFKKKIKILEGGSENLSLKERIEKIKEEPREVEWSYYRRSKN